MSQYKNNIKDDNGRKTIGFPSPYVSNQEKNSESYAKEIFKAVLDSTSAYRTNRLEQTTKCRQYARGKQSLRQYLDELKISGQNQYVNINYAPSKVLQKFEKIVVDDYQQLEEKPKAISKSHHIQVRKERKKSDLKFRMEFAPQIEALEQELGFPIEDNSIKVPEDEDELNLILSLNAEEREELLLNQMIDKVLLDNDIESLKRMFTSDIFQVNFAGYHVYTDNKGKIKVKFVATEDALYDSSMFEDFRDVSFAGSKTQMTIGEIRHMFQISESKEIELFKLASKYKSQYGNYASLSGSFNQDWRQSVNRPYDDFTVDVYHVWKKTVKNVGYIEGEDSYGKPIFDINSNIDEYSQKSKQNSKKKVGVSYPETAYEGWFAGLVDCPVVLEWKEASNQIRTGDSKEILECPYIFFMPENRGAMDDMSAVERVIPEIQLMDSQMLQIKLTLANHPPSGYAIDHEALLDVDLGSGEDLQPIDLESIFQQTGRLYYKRRKEDGAIDNSPPITPINISVAERIQTHLTVYNLALNNIRDILGINPNREGTANLNRVSTANAQTAISVSQTATYYIYRAFIKSTSRLVKCIGTRVLDVLTYGSPDKGYLKYLGQENIDFLKERESVVDAGNYEFKYNAQMTAEEKGKLQLYISTGIQAGSLSIPDALLIESLQDYELAEKYIRHLTNKNRKQAQKDAENMQAQQIQGQGDMAVRVEEAKRETLQIQSNLQAQEWKIKGESNTENKILDITLLLLQSQIEGKTIPAEWLEVSNLVRDNILIKQEKSALETEQQLQGQANQEQQDAILAQLQQAVQSGEITQEEAELQLKDMGMV